MECHQLVEKITSRIKIGYSRTLSYAGRLQIITAILFCLYNFWEAVFILPRSVLKEVDKQWRDYLWGNKEDGRKIALVSWDKVCVPKKYGGLNIKNCAKWNMASVGKLIWQLTMKQVTLWIRWVHGLCMKDSEDFWSHTPPQDSSWYWRKSNSLKAEMTHWYHNGRYWLTPNGKYSVSSSYQALLNNVQRWKEADLVWSSLLFPRNMFLLWLASRKRLLTKERLGRLQIQIDSTMCELCYDLKEETQRHLFYECGWTTELRDKLETWSGIKIEGKEVLQSIRWIKRRH
ncbi:uncharacterized protein LOC142179868 [Nicotiana tabacum]|uniref:Uncharacterized protein LOC142179868 n=1 Tax=Nicotiana tabacum TaxID=4097 RepID=A0AC58UBJ2_TOBAC